MGSYIQINSISIDLTNSLCRTDAGKCDHFSIRGYVSEIRKKDWKFCWPFPVDESREQPSCPPPDVPKYQCRCGHNFPQESAAKVIDKDDKTNFDCCITRCKSVTNSGSAALKSAAAKQVPMPDALERRNIDLNNNMCCVSDFLPFNNEKEKKAGAVLVRRTGCKGNGVIDVELASNDKCMDKSSAEIYDREAPSADNQCQKKLIKASTILGEDPTAIQARNTTDHTTGRPFLELGACNRTVLAGITDNMDEDDFQDHHLENSAALSHWRPRKVRLMADLLSENSDRKTEQIPRQGSPLHGTSNASATSQPHSIFPGTADTQEDLTLTSMSRSRKRKFLPDEAQRPADVFVQRVEIQVQKGDAKTIDTTSNTLPKSKDVMTGIGFQDAEKGYWSKFEIERNHIMSKKNSNTQVTDNGLILEACRGQQRENESNMNFADKAYAYKTLSSGFSPCAFTGKGMNKFPFHTLRIENDFNLSKGKGKMLQTNGELDSLSCQRHDMFVENSFAFSGGKIMSNMPVATAIPLGQGALNGKGLQEGLQVSLNSYLAAQVYNKKCIHQIENRPPFPLPFQEPISNVHQPERKDSETNVFGGPSIPSKHVTNVLSGKGVLCEETTGHTIEALEQLGVMKSFSDRTAKVSEHGTVDDMPMDIFQLLARNQHDRHLLDVENISSMLDKSTIRMKSPMAVGNTEYGKGELRFLKEGQWVKHQETCKQSNMGFRGENVKNSKRTPVHYFSACDGNKLGMNNLCSPQPPFGFEVSQSQNNHFSHKGSSHLGSAQNCKFNGGLESSRSSNATLQPHGGCSLHKTILQQDDEASCIWASLTSNHVSLGYDVPKKVVSQPTTTTSGNVDITSLQSGILHKQNMKRNFDISPTLHVAGLEKLNRNTTFNGMNGGYPVPGKHNGIEPHQNYKGSLDMYSNETMPAMHLLSLMDAGMQSPMPLNEGVNTQILRRPSYIDDTSKTHGTPKRQLSDYFRRYYMMDKPHGCLLGSSTFVASSSTQHDMNFVRATGGFDCRNSLESGKKEKTKTNNTVMLNSKQFSWPCLETELPVQHQLEVLGSHETLLPVRVTLGNSCMVNRNPADFTVPDTMNLYMINGEDLEFENIIPKRRPRFPTLNGCKEQRNMKGTNMKEHSKH